MTSAHFIFIPAVLLVGIIIGWILRGRSMADAEASADASRRRMVKRKL